MNIKDKLTSRKFWAMVAGIVSGLAMVFGLDDAIISTVSGAVVSVVSIATFIITEGKIDAERVAIAVEDVQTAIAIIEDMSAAISKAKK